MRRTLLILGASADQAFAFRTARAMGLRVITVDMKPDSPCFRLADRHAVVSTRDVAAIKAFLKQDLADGNSCSGVLVMGTDIPQVGAELSGYLGTPGIALEAALLATDKLKMKERLRARGVRIPWFQAVATLSELREAIATRGLPLVLKPIDRSGARGVFLLTEGANIEQLFEISRSISLGGQVMVEAYLQGPQISTESIIYQGNAYTPGFADRNYEMLGRFAPNIIENGGWVPSSADPGQRQAVERLVAQSAAALGISDGVVKGDVVLTAEGPALIEMAARLSGGDFCESLIPLGCGVNIVAAAIRIAIGDRPDLTALADKFTRGVVNRYFFPQPGRLLAVTGVEAVRNQSWLRKLEIWYQPGDMVPAIASHADRFGVFVVDGDTREQAEARAQWVYEAIRIETVPGEQSVAA